MPSLTPALTALFAALALVSASASAAANLVNVPLHRRDVPSHRLFSHARRPWYNQMLNHLAAPAATNVSTGVLSRPDHTTPIYLVDLPHPLPAAAPAAPAATSREGGEPASGLALQEQKMRGNMAPLGEYFLILTFAGQSEHVQIDTGSATTAVPFRACKSCLPHDHRVDPALGDVDLVKCTSPICGKDTCGSSCPSCSQDGACCSRRVSDGCYFQLRYADGSGVSGALYQAEVGIAGLKVPLSFGAILEASPDFEREDVDGIAGFAYKSLGCNPTCVLPLFDSLVAAKKVEENIFSVCTSPRGGTLTLGGSNPALYHGPLKYVPIHQTMTPMFYRVRLSGVSVNGRDPQLPSFSVGIVDSGTTLLIITQEAYDALHDHFVAHYCNVPGLCKEKGPKDGKARTAVPAQSGRVDGALGAGRVSRSSAQPVVTVRKEDGTPVSHAEEKTWFAPGYCVNLSDEMMKLLPTITIKLDGVDLELGPFDYMLDHKVTNSFGTTIYRCLGIASLGGLSGMPNDVIIGNTVLRKYFVEYDRKNSRLGFAHAKDCHDPTAKEPIASYSAARQGGLPGWVRQLVSIAALIGVVAVITWCVQRSSRASSTGYQTIEGR